MKKRIALCVGYQGTAYHGWQKQKKISNTIQEIMEKAIAEIAQHPIELIASGRTDKGVHALRQIIHFDTTAKRDTSAWLFGVNRYLPDDIAIQYATEVIPDFHARFSAKRRFYRYLLYPAKVCPVFLKDRVGWIVHAVDILRMNQAIQLLLGQHDFSSFRSADCQATTPIRTVDYAKVYGYHGLICFDIAANGFLHRMIRNIVGALLYVGLRRWTLQEFETLLTAKSRHTAPPTCGAEGLYFLGAEYSNEYHLDLPEMANYFWGDNEFMHKN